MPNGQRKYSSGPPHAAGVGFLALPALVFSRGALGPTRLLFDCAPDWSAEKGQ